MILHANVFLTIICSHIFTDMRSCMETKATALVDMCIRVWFKFSCTALERVGIEDIQLVAKAELKAGRPDGESSKARLKAFSASQVLYAASRT
jgi:hypothetical protein